MIHVIRTRADKVAPVAQLAGLLSAVVRMDLVEEYVNRHALLELQYGVMVLSFSYNSLGALKIFTPTLRSYYTRGFRYESS